MEATTTPGTPERTSGSSSGKETADALVRQHPVLELVDGDGKSAGVRAGAGGGHVADADLEVFAYSKLWLRGRSAAFRLDFLALLRSIRRLRRTERWEALRNMAFEAVIQRAEAERVAG